LVKDGVAVINLSLNDIERFLSKINVPHPDWRGYHKKKRVDGCWEWKGAKFPRGYGQFLMLGRPYAASRIAYTILVDRSFDFKTDPLFVCHTCDNPPCVRPAHLFLGNNSDNMYDAVAKGILKSVKGSKNINCKLNPSQVRKIRKLLKTTNLTQRQIGQRFNVSQTHISYIHLGKTYEDVT
jgi:predicted XRE-type DNA-binding protein